MAKDRMIRLLGEERLLLPSLIASALEANERVKYLLALVQAARAAADGATRIGNLRDERLAAGVRDAALDDVVAASARVDDGRYRIPGASQLARRAVAEVDRMLAPLRAADVPAAATLDARRQAVAATLPADGDLLRAQDIGRLCAGPGERGDSLHLVVMDAHRHLNELAADAAPESISGARAYDLDPAQRELVQALMRGVHATERLKLGHPGLDTIAMTTQDGLVIENDLGTTDAHVLVLRVTGRAVTITYTDVHLERALFFQGLLDPWPVRWEDTRSRAATGFEEGMFHLVTGRFESAGDAELQRFLERLGSRLVFIIDWNRARKRLRRLVGNRAAIGLLRWAAEEDVGHIPFLVAGGDGLVYAALQFAGAPEARAGVSLRDVLGPPAARRYLQALLRICSEQLLAGRSVSLIADQAAAELIGYLRSARQEIQELALRHAELDVELAEAARDGVEQAILGETERCRATAARAQASERDADALVTEARTEATRAPDQSELLDLVQAADDIADCAEEAAFYATLLPALPADDAVVPQVRRIARLVLTAAREYLRAVQLSTELHRGGPRDDMDAFLAAAHAAIETEREVDAAQRAVHEVLATGAQRPHATLFVVVELTRALEEASDALMHCAHLLREQTLGRVVRSEGGYQWRETAPAPPAHGRAGHSDHVYVVEASSAPVPAVTAIGAKAHGLARLVRAGMRVPDAAVLTTSLWHASRGGADAGIAVSEAVAAAVDAIAGRTGLRFGSRRRPLLVSVRSGAPVSMPGMLETVLNVGLCDATVGGLVAQTGNPRLVWDCYRRLIESFAAVVHGVAHDPFDQALRDRLRAAGAGSPRELSARALRELAAEDRRLFAALAGVEFPQDPEAQLLAAVRAVLSSWDAPKARAYRRLHGIPEPLGTAVILQRMVFGNAGGISGAGVGFTRDPALGDRRMYVDFMFDAQGEDVVAGRQTVTGVGELALTSPDLIAELEDVGRRLEAEFADAQEFELTVQDGQLFLLQARRAKRTPWAALRIAVDQVDEGLISPAQGLERLDGLDLNSIVRRRVDAGQAGEALARAVAAGTGVAIGPIALDRAAAERQAAAGTAPVLVRADSVTEDVAAVGVSAGVLTRSGSRTSHAAVVARELGIPCLVGCDALELDLAARTIRLGGRMLAEGETVCLDGDSGLVYLGAPRVTEERPTDALDRVDAWRRDGRAAPDIASPPRARRRSTTDGDGLRVRDGDAMSRAPGLTPGDRIDLHCHILPGIDDGARDLGDAVAMARQAQDDGIAAVCATPHIRHDHDVRIAELPARRAELVQAIAAAGCRTQILPGGEVAATIAGHLDDDELSALTLGGGGRWILLEPAPGPLGDDLDAVVGALHQRGFRCLIAHPERHAGADLAARLARLVGDGALVQATAAALTDAQAQAAMLGLARAGLIHVLGSDAHSAAVGRPVAISEAMRVLAAATPVAAHVDWVASAGPLAIVAGADVTPPFSAMAATTMPGGS